jgi:hypothetical protein
VVRVEIHVHPGASRSSVGGTYDGCLVVRVTQPAEGGKATSAALQAVASALSLPRGSVSLVRGATSRRKLIEVDVHDRDDVQALVEQLRCSSTS